MYRNQGAGKFAPSSFTDGTFLDEHGQPIPGYSVQDCVYVNGDAVDYEVEWLEKGKDVSSLAGKTVQLVFELHGAKLFALQFQQGPNTSAAMFPPAALVASKAKDHL